MVKAKLWEWVYTGDLILLSKEDKYLSEGNKFINPCIEKLSYFTVKIMGTICEQKYERREFHRNSKLI